MTEKFQEKNWKSQNIESSFLTHSQEQSMKSLLLLLIRRMGYDLQDGPSKSKSHTENYVVHLRDGTREYYTKRNKAIRERQLSYELFHCYL